MLHDMTKTLTNRPQLQRVAQSDLYKGRLRNWWGLAVEIDKHEPSNGNSFVGKVLAIKAVVTSCRRTAIACRKVPGETGAAAENVRVHSRTLILICVTLGRS